MNFHGVYNNSIDPKGRASIPAKFRDDLASQDAGGGLVITQEKDGLAAYPEPVWKEIVAKVEALPPGPGKDDLYLTRVSPATQAPFDKNGRVQLSQSHRDYAGLDSEIREIVVVGHGRKIMIWSKAKHADMRAQAEARIEENPQVLADLGF